MSDIYVCPECEQEFQESQAPVMVQNLTFNAFDDAIQSVSLIHCPECATIVVAMFDSMECSEQFDA